VYDRMMTLARYMCNNCKDLLLKSITSVLDHVWAKHKIEVTKIWHSVIRAEDTRLPPMETSNRKVSGFRCENCKVSFSKASSVLVHLDKTHGIHIWYEKGLTKKRVYFDGILDKSRVSMRATADTAEKEFVPLSQRPYEPRKATSRTHKKHQE